MRRCPLVRRIAGASAAALTLACAAGRRAGAPAVGAPSCPDERTVAAHVADLDAGRVSRGFGGDLSLADAECARRALQRELPRVLGRPIGYKAGLTNRAAQERNGLSAPIWGRMYSRWMVESGARVPARFGARPHYEPDLVVVVKDPALADAATPLDALRHIAAVVPFIELPDLMLDGMPRGTALIAINVGFRGGVLGAPVPVDPTQAFLDALGAMTVVVTEDASARELARVGGDLLLGHPINAALWLARALRTEGITLRPGDLLSLGAFVPPASPEPGTGITVRYVGLPGNPAVTVHFE